MVSEKEKFLGLMADAESLVSRITGLKGQVETLRQEIAPLETEALKAEIIGDPNSAKKKAAFEGSQKRIREFELELEQSQRRFTVMQQVLPEFREKARIEHLEEWKKVFQKAIHPFIKKVKEAHALEVELEKIRKDAAAEASRLGIAAPLADWPVVLMRRREYPGSFAVFEDFISSMKNLGYDIHE